MEIYMDEKSWKLSKKEGRSSSCNGRRRVAAGAGAEGAVLKASASTREGARTTAAAARSFSRRCAGLVKEQRARFYIVRRCVTMLICWRDYP